MKRNYRDSRDRSRSRSREKEDRPYYHKHPPRDNHRNVIKLHVGNLPLHANEDMVLMQFEKYGKVDDVKIMRKNATGQPLRETLYGFIVMSNDDEARRAIEVINHNPELGWHVSYSKEKPRQEESHYQPHHHHHQNRSPDRSHRPREYHQHGQHNPHHRRDYDDDHYNRNRRDRSPRRNEYDNRRREYSQSPERRMNVEKTPNQSSALRNLLQNNGSNPADLMTILQLPPDQLAELTTSMERNILNGNTILVRELWFGNLPENIQEKKLRNTVEMFGDVENIEFFNKPNGTFAFIKFKKVSQASKANEGVQNLKILLESPQLKIAFSDHQRRKNVVGDNIEYEKDEELTSIVYIGFTSGSYIAPEGAIREMFSRYGEVLNVNVRQSPKDNSAKPFALVEMGKLEQAKYARERIYLNDHSREKRMRLGDKNAELCLLIKAKEKPPGHGPQHQGQQYPPRNFDPTRPQHFQKQQYPHQQNFRPQHQNSHFNPQGQQQQPYGNYGGYNNDTSYNQPRNFYGGIGGSDISNQNQRTGYNPSNTQPPTITNPSQVNPAYPQQQTYPKANPSIPNTYGSNLPPTTQPTQPNMMNPMQNMQGNPNIQKTYSPIQNRQYPPNVSPGSKPNMTQNFFPAGSGNVPPYNQNIPVAPQHGFSDVSGATSAEKKAEEAKKAGKFGLLDSLQELLAQKTQQKEAQPSKQEDSAKKIEVEPVEAEVERNTIWSGFITKNKQNRVGTDAHLIQGEEAILKDYFNLNVSHRTMFDEVTKRQPQTIVVFTPANETQTALFTDYLKYFAEKQRAGVVSLKKNVLYILPPCEEAFKIHQFGQNELLGVFVDSGDVPKESIA